MKRLHRWAANHVHSRHAMRIFGALIFIESFFLVPVSTLFSFYCIEKPKKVFFFASIASIASLLGSIVGYHLGIAIHNAWDSFGQKFIGILMNSEDFDAHIAVYRSYEGWQIALATLTPLPFKLITISAGFCRLHFATFLFYSALGRTCKFFALATAFHLFGERVLIYINRYLRYIVGILILMSALLFIRYYGLE